MKAICERANRWRKPRRARWKRRILQEGPETVAAFISEPIQGAGGVMIADEGYFDLVQAICKKHEVLFIVDEVICGFGRTGNWFGSDAFAINPDIMQFAKGVTSGYMPLGGIQVTDEIRDVINGAPEEQSWMHGYTPIPGTRRLARWAWPISKSSSATVCWRTAS